MCRVDKDIDLDLDLTIRVKIKSIQKVHSIISIITMLTSAAGPVMSAIPTPA